MDRRLVPPRPLLATASLVAASVGLHAMVISGVVERMDGGPTAPRVPTPVEVVLIAPPSPAPGVAVVAPMTVDASPAAASPPSPPRAQPAPRPEPAPRPRVAAPSVAASAPVLAAATPVQPVQPSDLSGVALEVAQGGPPAAETSERVEDAAVAESPADAPAQAPAVSQVGGAATRDAGAVTAEPPRTPETDRAGASDADEPTPVAAGGERETHAAARPGAGARAVAAAALPPLPASQRHRFRVYWGDYTEARSVARLEYRLVRDGDRYEIRTAAEAEGLISLVYSGTLSQVSVGRLGPAGLEPLQYSEQRGKRPERSVAFDPQAHRLTPTGGRGEPVAMPPGTQDRLSVFYQIGLLARAEPGRFVAGAVQELPVATLRDVRVERFEVIGDETLPAPGGPIRTLHLRRPPPPGTDDPRIDVWLGYDFDMLPVRLRVEDGGQRVLDQVIERGG